MPGKLTVFPSQRASRFRIMQEGESVEVGRDPRCDLVIEDQRVSKRHARLRWTGTGWVLQDLQSRNGTTLNGEPLRAEELRDRDWISFGGLIARFERLTAAQAATLDSQRLARVHTSAEMFRRLDPDLEPPHLLRRLLEAAMEVTRTERGFVLVAGPDGVLRAEIAAGFTAEELSDEHFSGSLGAVRQALQTAAPVVASNARADPRLGKRPSVVAHGIGSLACLPLRQDGKVFGLVYVDSRKVGPAFSEPDIETLEALIGHAATALAAPRSEGNPLPAASAERELVDRLQRRIEELLPII